MDAAMRTITEETVICTTPERIWNFLVSLHTDGNYKKWHPRDHILYRLLKGDMAHAGSEAYFQEHLGTFTLRLRYRLIKARFPEYLEYAAAFPLSLLRAGKASFTIASLDAHHTQLTAYAEYGYTVPVLGNLIEAIAGLVVNQADIVQHVHEEGEYMKALLET